MSWSTDERFRQIAGGDGRRSRELGVSSRDDWSEDDAWLRLCCDAPFEDTSDDFAVSGTVLGAAVKPGRGSRRGAEVEGKTKTPGPFDRFKEVCRFRLSKIGRSTGRPWASERGIAKLRGSVYTICKHLFRTFLATPQVGEERAGNRSKERGDRRSEMGGRGQDMGDGRWGKLGATDETRMKHGWELEGRKEGGLFEQEAAEE